MKRRLQLSYTHATQALNNSEIQKDYKLTNLNVA